MSLSFNDIVFKLAFQRNVSFVSCLILRIVNFLLSKKSLEMCSVSFFN